MIFLPLIVAMRKRYSNVHICNFVLLHASVTNTVYVFVSAWRNFFLTTIMVLRLSIKFLNLPL